MYVSLIMNKRHQNNMENSMQLMSHNIVEK